MEIDKRYIQILANNVPYKSNKWFKLTGLIGMGLAIIGAFLLFSALNRPNDGPASKIIAVNTMNAGTVISITGLLCLGVSTAFKNREWKRKGMAFLQYFEKNGSLPPWPDEKPVAVKNISTDSK
jgi:drug/metabolite transporter (DMT)-like permease